MRFSSLVTAIAFSALVSGAAFALDAAQPTPGPTPAADAGAKAAKSADCYKQADVKNSARQGAQEVSPRVHEGAMSRT